MAATLNCAFYEDFNSREIFASILIHTSSNDPNSNIFIMIETRSLRTAEKELFDSTSTIRNSQRNSCWIDHLDCWIRDENIWLFSRSNASRAAVYVWVCNEKKMHYFLCESKMKIMIEANYVRILEQRWSPNIIQLRKKHLMIDDCGLWWRQKSVRKFVCFLFSF